DLHEKGGVAGATIRAGAHPAGQAAIPGFDQSVIEPGDRIAGPDLPAEELPVELPEGLAVLACDLEPDDWIRHGVPLPLPVPCLRTAAAVCRPRDLFTGMTTGAMQKRHPATTGPPSTALPSRHSSVEPRWARTVSG